MLGPEARSSAAPDSAGVSVEQTVTSLYRPARGNSDHRTNLENNLVYGKTALTQVPALLAIDVTT